MSELSISEMSQHCEALLDAVRNGKVEEMNQEQSEVEQMRAEIASLQQDVKVLRAMGQHSAELRDHWEKIASRNACYEQEFSRLLVDKLQMFDNLTACQRLCNEQLLELRALRVAVAEDEDCARCVSLRGGCGCSIP